MLISEKNFINGIEKQINNNFIDEEIYTKYLESEAQKKQWEKDRLEKQAQEEAIRKTYQRGEMPLSHQKAYDEALKEFTNSINADIEAQNKKAAAEMAKINDYINAQKEREQIERLLEIAENKALSLDAQIAAAEGNEALLEKLNNEKADIESDIKFYKAKFDLLENNG